MGANRRFFAVEGISEALVFTIDTNNIVPGAANGSERNNQFILPLYSTAVSAGNNFIIRVNDGRPDVSVVGQADTIAKKKIAFSVPGVYVISIFGTVSAFSFFSGDNTDRLKITELNQWSNSVGYINAFYNCSNLVIKATNNLYLRGTLSRLLFNRIKGFYSRESISALIMSDVTDTYQTFAYITQSLPQLPNSFWRSAPDLIETFFGTKIDVSVDKVEIISDNITSATRVFYNTSSSSSVRLIMRTPNLQSIDSLWYGAASPTISLGEVDVRSLRTCNQLFPRIPATSAVDATLLGWVNNFDWTAIPTIANKVTISFQGGKYSNNPAVISAKAFLESKGYVFTNLTMA